MPGKIAFQVIHISGQDDSYRGTDLNVHCPTTKGWHSQRFCSYPQDIVIQLEKRSRVRKIQILSHQYLIATKVEFYIGDVLSPSSGAPALVDAKFTRLGYVALSNNERTGFRARELKSVHVDAVGCFIKFIIHKNHLNKSNQHNQVGIISINIIGDALSDVTNQHRQLQVDNNSETALKDARFQVESRPDYISPLDDLAFDMYQDPDVAQVIRKLECKKMESVRQERYDVAKKIKMTIEQLQMVGEKLGKAEVEKRQAIDNEDYDKAKLKKQQMDEYRLLAYEKLRINDFLDSSLVVLGISSDVVNTTDDTAVAVQLEPVAEDQTIDSNKQTESLNKTPPQTQRYVSYDERPLPAIRSKMQLTSRRSPVHSVVSPADAFSARMALAADERQVTPDVSFQEAGRPGTGDIEQLSEKDEREAAPLIDAFDINIAGKMYSRHWSLREEALVSVHQTLQDLDASSSRDDASMLVRAALVAFNRAIKDNVFSVFSAALALHYMILSEFIVKHRISRNETASFLERTLPVLLAKIGDMSARHREAIKTLIIKESHLPEIKSTGTLFHECLRPFKQTTAPRLALSLTDIVGQLYTEHGLQEGGIMLTSLMSFLVNGALRHTSGEVRDKAERLLITLYEHVGSPVRDQLSNCDEKTRKSLLYKQLYKAFDRIDSVKTRDVAASNTLKTANSKHDADKVRADNVIKTTNNKQKQKENASVKADITHLSLSKEPENDSDRMCIFCGKFNENFTEDGLDLHYWKSCPVLKHCQYCRQVVEISSLTDHLLRECDNHMEFKQCARCMEAIHSKHYIQHTNDALCLPCETNKARCPLCHKNIESSEISWRNHLMSTVGGCQNNSRRQQQHLAAKSEQRVFNTKPTKSDSRGTNVKVK